MCQDEQYQEIWGHTAAFGAGKVAFEQPLWWQPLPGGFTQHSDFQNFKTNKAEA